MTNENENKHTYRNRASSRRSFLFVVPMSKMLLRASTPSICPAIPRFEHSAFKLASLNSGVNRPEQPALEDF
jgi:hypothetical protein